MFQDLEKEGFGSLPERLETSEFNIAGVSLSQSNLNVQIAAVALQAAAQSNRAGVVILQSA